MDPHRRGKGSIVNTLQTNVPDINAVFTPDNRWRENQKDTEYTTFHIEACANIAIINQISPGFIILG
jgi:hypothetical protein